ncbi:hypothetical protein V2J09_017602 [Rumex salicifolius]
MPDATGTLVSSSSCVQPARFSPDYCSSAILSITRTTPRYSSRRELRNESSYHLIKRNLAWWYGLSFNHSTELESSRWRYFTNAFSSRPDGVLVVPRSPHGYKTPSAFVITQVTPYEAELETALDDLE